MKYSLRPVLYPLHDVTREESYRMAYTGIENFHEEFEWKGWELKIKKGHDKSFFLNA
jgi:hypothetical protein